MSDPIDWAVRDQPLGSRPAPVAPEQAYPPTYGPPPAAPPRRRRVGLLIGLVVAVAVLLGATTAGVLVLTNTIGADTFDVHGSLQVSGCGSLGYQDIRDGTQVVVSDEHGTMLALGHLVSDGICTWLFTVAKVPAGHPVYGVSLGHRGSVQYIEAELRAGPALTLD